MPAYILKTLCTNDLLTDLQVEILNRWQLSCTEQELNYYTKIRNIFFFK